MTLTKRAPKQFSHKVILITFLFLFTIIAGGCTTLARMGWPFPPAQPISGPVEIGPEWVEITPPYPLVKYDWSAEIIVDFDGYDKQSGVNRETVTLLDGKKTKIEAFLIDDKGESYPLYICTSGFGLCGRLPREDKNTGERDSNFREDRTYPKFKIRSEIPIKCNKIEWYGRVAK